MAELWILCAALSTLACDRGCTSPSPSEPGSLASAFAVKQDCPPGLARCVEGSVQVSEGRASCPGCPCAWRRIEACDAGCLVEGEVFVRDPDEASSLCKHLQVSATRPPIDAAVAGCPNEGERFLCHGGMVYACPKGSSAVPVAVCTNGCARDDETLADPKVDVAAATALMCSTHDAGVTSP